MPYLNQFLKRLPEGFNLLQALRDVSVSYQLGQFISYELIPYGYSDFNLKLKTTVGTFFVKIFSKDRKFNEINDIVNRFLKLRQAGIKVPKVFSFNKKYIYHKELVFLCVMEYIKGRDFTSQEALDDDIKKIATNLAHIHQTNFKLFPSYDSWGTANLYTEFEKRKIVLKRTELKLLLPVITEFRSLNLSKLPQSNIHGDLHDEHILKTPDNKLYIIDLETMQYSASIIDVAIFLGSFHFKNNQNIIFKNKVLELVLKEYEKIRKLTKEEKKVLPMLIRSTFAVYFIRLLYEKRVNKDNSRQTQLWLARSIYGLHYYK